MLVLTRKKDQSLIIGDQVCVTVLEVSGDSVRLGIEAPAAVTVYRSEIYRAIQEENRAAVVSRELVAGLKVQDKASDEAGEPMNSKA
jgi:carbon storage regulator